MMIEKRRLLGLLQQLRDDPVRFDSDGKAYELLQEYFDGKPLETLRPFLKHPNVAARRSAAFVASELGNQGGSLILDIVPLIEDEDLHIQWYALESVAVCTAGNNVEQYVNVVRALGSPHSSICRLAMRLIANANQLQISACIGSIDKLKPYENDHQQGLELVLRWETANPAEVVGFLDGPGRLLRAYGAIVAKRRIADYPALLQHAKSSDDQVISTFAEQALDCTF